MLEDARTVRGARPADGIPAPSMRPYSALALLAFTALFGGASGGCTTSKAVGPSQEGSASAVDTARSDAPAASAEGGSIAMSIEAGAPPAAAAASSSEKPSLPAVAVQNIGMHIGGGPNDAATKAPIADSVAPYFARLRACWSTVSDPRRGGTFGVDLLVPAEGGHASVSHPRTRLTPDAFRDCVTHVFEEVEFARPRGGRTTVSYALSFEPPQGDAGIAH